MHHTLYGDDIQDEIIVLPPKPKIITREYIENFMRALNIDPDYYTINKNLIVDVDGDVDLSNKNLTSIPIQFGKVTGDFYCSGNKLTSLRGSPYTIRGDFSCSNNKLTTLEGAPQSVGGDFQCYSYNKGMQFTKRDVEAVCKVKGDIELDF